MKTYFEFSVLFLKIIPFMR